MSVNFDLDKTYQYLLILLAFLMPITVAGANLVIIIVCFIWLFSGGYKSKFQQILNNKLMIASIIFFLFHVIGLLWTEDLKWGFHIVHKMWYFFLLWPILFTITKKEFEEKYINSFLYAIFVTIILSFLVWFEIIPEFKNATVSNPTPFMSHISYNPILAFAFYIVGHKICFNKKDTPYKLWLLSFFALSIAVNMFITGGRAGQIVFFVVVALLIFRFFQKNKIKAILLIIFASSSIFITAYNLNDNFQLRMSGAFENAINYNAQNITSTGLRITFQLNSIDIIKENFIFGVGTGDFPTEYKRMSLKNTPKVVHAEHPHNMYSLITVQLGFLGLISLLSIFYYQIRLSFHQANRFNKDVGFVLPIMFMVLSMSDSYLLGHYTSLLYVFFGSFLYKESGIK